MTSVDETGEPLYPSDTDLGLIEQWPWQQLPALFAFVRKRWRYADDGGWEVPQGYTFELHTFGWSGNEELIGALARNQMAWTLTWQRSERGGHYLFAIPNTQREDTEPEGATPCA